jgi:enolase
MKVETNKKIYLRNVLMSSGEFTEEAVIDLGKVQIFETAPQGMTLGLNEASILTKNKITDKTILDNPEIFSLSQEDFDRNIATKFTSQISTALSLVFLKFLAQKTEFRNSDLYKYISGKYKKNVDFPTPIFNILNGGLHAGNKLEFCKFMIIPRGKSIESNLKIASEIYLDLKKIIENKLGKQHTLVGREGGFAPDISDVESALALIKEAINLRHSGECGIAIDVAANNFSEKIISDSGKKFQYTINGRNYTSEELIEYYQKLITKFPEITYLEDLFHEQDINAWKQAKNLLGGKVLIVGDDLTVSNIKYLEEHKDCINACILKINQVGTVTGLIEAYNFCEANSIQTIISQRSGETDSDIISHLSVGLGSNFIKAGAPARERIIKYNTLLRLWDTSIIKK